MSITDLFSRLTLSQKDAEVIFDRDEPVGAPTDMVMPRRYWFRRNKRKEGGSLPAGAQKQSRTSRR